MRIFFYFLVGFPHQAVDQTSSENPDLSLAHHLSEVQEQKEISNTVFIELDTSKDEKAVKPSTRESDFNVMEDQENKGEPKNLLEQIEQRNKPELIQANVKRLDLKDDVQTMQRSLAKDEQSLLCRSKFDDQYITSKKIETRKNILQPSAHKTFHSEDKFKRKLPTEQKEEAYFENSTASLTPIQTLETINGTDATPRISKGIPCYPMKSDPRGLCVILSNTDFSKARSEGNDLDDRLGSFVDVQKLGDLFAWLRFEVKVYQDKIAYDMYEILKYSSRLDHSRYDCFVCCILTHGCAKGLYGTDGKTLHMAHVTKLYGGLSCQTLQNKPKLFFLQCCRGFLTDTGYSKDGPYLSSSNAQLFNSELERRSGPAESDFFIGYPTPPGEWIELICLLNKKDRYGRIS